MIIHHPRPILIDKEVHLYASDDNTLYQPGEDLSPDSAQAVFEETKQMMEELVLETQKRAELIKEEAKKEAQIIKEEALKESEAIKDSAFKDGYSCGYEEGLVKSQNEIENLANETKLLVEQFKIEQEQYFKERERGFVELIFALTEKILGTVLETKPETINNLVQNVLKEVKDNEKIVLKVNPIHIPYLTNQQEKSEQFQIVQDQSIKPGDFLLITENGFVESKIDEQIQVLKKAILEVSEHVGD